MARSLASYQSKRDFEATPEPAGGRRTRKARAPRFVVQEHSATAMHWDLRLEHDGVLLSWAVPKGVPLVPGEQRLAVRTEDHPLEYLDFEGEIPEGSYGAGSMSIWDHGTYELEELADDKVHMRLAGGRARGRYVLVRTRVDPRGKEQWLLRRLDPPDDPDREPLPERIEPMPLPRAERLPRPARAWAFEVDWGGRRALVYGSGGRIRVTDRAGADITDHFPELVRLGRALGAHDVVLDGELVVLDAAGRPHVGPVHARIAATSGSSIRAQAKESPATFVAFDLLHLDGHDLRDQPYEERRRLLGLLLERGEHWQVPEHHVGEGRELLDGAQRLGLPGVVAKRLGSTYHPARSSDRPDWVRVAARRTG
ncbi:MAG: ligD [Thermoleophilia bacterium]|nr:ligD [Thermoleophilia bacterium]